MRRHILLLFAFIFTFAVNISAQDGSRTGIPSDPEKFTSFEYNNSLRSDNLIDESFEGVTFPPAGWAKINVVGTGWERIQTGVTPIPGWNGGVVIPVPNGQGGNFMAWMNYTFGGATSNDSWLVTPLLENVQPGDSLSFWMRMFSNLYADNVDVKISTTVNNSPAAFNVTVANIVLTASAADTGWKFYAYEIGSLVPAGSDIYIGFREHVADNFNDGNAIFIDLVKAGGEGGPGGCTVGSPTDPSPANSAANVPLSTSQLSWTNGVETVTTTLRFGTDPGSLSVVQSGTLANSWTITPALAPSTTYYWRVEAVGDTCSTMGPVWSFTTESTAILAFFDDFEANNDTTAQGWVITNDGGNLVWRVFGPTYPNLYTLPCGAGCGKVLSADSDEGGSSVGPTTLLSTARIDQTFDATLYTQVFLEFDNDFRIIDADDHSYVEVSTDGGSNWTIAWSVIGAALRNTHEVVNLSSLVAGQTFQVRFRSVQPGWDWWWTIDNVAIYLDGFIPVELVSFNASVISGGVNLSWITATETNNYGFEVERKTAGQEFTKVGFVEGYGTTTQTRNYNFVDNSVTTGSYTYRLKQVDFDGTFEYSSEIEVDLTPAVYSLAQNYPNPFNPSTKISFGLASDSKVTLKIFDVLGQEVVTLVNGTMNAGVHNIEFNASKINSGVYFYQIEAEGIDGSRFSEVKKMMLTK